MIKKITSAVVILSSLISSVVYANTASTEEGYLIIEEGSGWQLVSPKNPSSTSDVSAQSAPSNNDAVYILKGEGGINNSPFPLDIKAELLGFYHEETEPAVTAQNTSSTSGNSSTNTKSLQDPNYIPPVIESEQIDFSGVEEEIYVHAEIINMIIDGKEEELKTKYGHYAVYDPQDETEGVSAAGWDPTCHTKWRNDEHVSRFNLNNDFPKSINSSEVTADFQLPIAGNGRIEFQYKFKRHKWTCIPIAWGYRGTEIKVNGTINNATINISGNVIDTTIIDFNEEAFDVSLFDSRFFVGPFLLRANGRLPLSFGLKLSAKTDLSIGVDLQQSTTGGGSFLIDIDCDSKGRCNNRSDSNIQFENLDSGNINGGISTTIKLEPSIDLGFHVDLFAYEWIHLVTPGTGLRFSTPATLFSYLGSTCGDADGNGNSEYVTGSYIDINAVLGGYVQIKYLQGWSLKKPIKLGAFEIWKKGYDLSGTWGISEELWSTNLYFHAISSNGLFQPVISNVEPMALNDTYIGLSPRNCLPLSGAMNVDYNLSDGNGWKSVKLGSNGINLTPDLPLGVYDVTAITRDDGLGRRFPHESTTKIISVTIDGKRFVKVADWLPAILSILL